jgi:preprotein translocase subunit YajC
VGYLVLIAIFAAIFWLAVVVPQRRSRRRREDELESIRSGDEVVTAGGIIATVRAIEDEDELRVEIAPAVEERLARKAVAAVLRREEAADEAAEQEHPVGS